MPVHLLVARICLLVVERCRQVSNIDHRVVVLAGAFRLFVGILHLAMPRCSRILLDLALRRVPVSVADLAALHQLARALRPCDELPFGPSFREA